MSKGKMLSWDLALLILVGAGMSTYAQEPTGLLIGTVTDENGIPLPGVAVTAVSDKLVGQAATLTEENGIYRLFALHPGSYDLSFALQGFKPVRREGIVVRMEQTIKLDIRMEQGAIQEEVTVIGRSPLIDVKNTTRETTLARTALETLPRSRTFDSLLTTMSGVSLEPLLAGISVDGASGAENVFHVDGTDVTNLQTGVLGQNGVVIDFVEEVQVKAGGYAAEFGGSLGGVVNVITRQGGNSFHGELVGYLSGSALAGKERDTLRLGLYDASVAEYVNYQDLYGKDDVRKLEAGFSLGGYVIKDRLWFFASAVPSWQATDRRVTFEPSLLAGDFTRRDTAANLQAKLTAQPFPFLRLSASVVGNPSWLRGDVPGRDGADDPDAPWSDYGWDFPNWSGALHADFTFGNKALLGFRASFFSSNDWADQKVVATEPRWEHGVFGNSIYPDIPAEYIRPSGWSNMSWDAAFGSKRQKERRAVVGGDFTYYLDLAGEHALKAGLQWTRVAEDWDKSLSQPLIWLCWGEPAFLWGVDYGIGRYGHYAVFGNDATGPWGFYFDTASYRLALYLQDSWTIEDRLTINFGLRTENEYFPSYSKDPALRDQRPIKFSFADKLAPRLGLVYDVAGDSSLKVFASYGIYYDVMKLYAAARVFGGYQTKAALYSLDTYDWTKIGIDGYYPGTFYAVVDQSMVDLNCADPDLKPMSQSELTFGAEKRLAENISATARFVYKHLRYAVEDFGAGEAGSVSGDVRYYFANPGYGYTRPMAEGGLLSDSYPAMPRAKRDYLAFSLALEKRFAGNWFGGFSYTLSRLAGNYPGLASSDENGRNSPNLERSFDYWFLLYTKDHQLIDGPLPTDRTHYLKAYGAYVFPWRLTVGTVVQAMSGVPITEIWNVWDADMRPYNRGNLGRTPFLWFVNLYAEYRWKIGRSSLTFSLNVDNLFDTKTATQRYPYRTMQPLDVSDEQLIAKNWELESSGFVPNPMFNLASAFYPPIQARLGVRFSF